MTYYNNPGQINDEAINIAGGKTFQVVQIADIAGNVAGTSGSVLATLLSGLTIPTYDSVVVGYTNGRVTTFTYKSAGSNVAVVTVTYNATGDVTGISQSA
jgi:hypothetical protein